MHWFQALACVLFATLVTSFAPTRHQHLDRRRLLLMASKSSPSPMDRRNVLKRGAFFGLATLLPPSAAHAKKQSELLTPENVESAFAALKFELEGPNGGVSVMQQFIDKRDFEGLLDFTKTYDQVLRKQKWARAKSFLTNNAEKEVATIQGNAVTFDLIGINRSSRAGQENPEQASKYLNELRTDLQKMIDMQSTIQYEQDGFDAYTNAVKGN